METILIANYGLAKPRPITSDPKQTSGLGDPDENGMKFIRFNSNQFKHR